MKNIFVFGNPDVENDSTPIQLIPELEKMFPEISFTILDPNEEWEVERNMVIIDTVVGIEKVTVFESLEAFSTTPRVTCHDFDAYTNLQFLKKLGTIDATYIIGIPVGVPENELLPELNEAIQTAYNKIY